MHIFVSKPCAPNSAQVAVLVGVQLWRCLVLVLPIAYMFKYLHTVGIQPWEYPGFLVTGDYLLSWFHSSLECKGTQLAF